MSRPLSKQTTDRSHCAPLQIELQLGGDFDAVPTRVDTRWCGRDLIGVAMEAYHREGLNILEEEIRSVNFAGIEILDTQPLTDFDLCDGAVLTVLADLDQADMRLVAIQVAEQHPCPGCDKIHVTIGDRVTRHPKSWTRGNEDGGRGMIGTVMVDHEDPNPPGGRVEVHWDSGNHGIYPWNKDGSTEIIHVGFTRVTTAVKTVAKETGLPSHLALQLLKSQATLRDAETSVWQTSDVVPAIQRWCNTPPEEMLVLRESLEKMLRPLRLYFRARVLPDRQELQRIISESTAKGGLDWSDVREAHIGQECHIIKMDDDDTVKASLSIV